jgi:hypothetical protein
MSNTTITTDTRFDKALFRAVATAGGGSGLMNEVLEKLKNEIGPRHPRKFIKGTAEPTVDEARIIAQVLQQYDESITSFDIINL